MKEKFYITTPIYYPSSKLTLGNCYTTVVCDSIARFNRMLGKDVFYLTGTDEHGQKIQRKAQAQNKTELEFLDEIITDTKDLWKLLDISYDDFIRTTEQRHIECVQKCIQKLYDKGDIYKSSYEGLYCTPCESFWVESQLVDGKCPDCGRPVEKNVESAYFFKLSKYENKIKELFEKNKDFLVPTSRVNEMMTFINEGLKDICISRSSVSWGIPVPFDESHTVYVWVDALLNYITALGYLSDDESKFNKYWPADVHFVGKEIVRFHSILWPALLMALEIPLPNKVFGHGWILFGEDKLSKSKETFIKDIIDPRILSDKYSVDAVRFFLIKEIPFGNDGSYTQQSFLESINAHLSNNIGNLVSRTLSMIDKYFNGIIPNHTEDNELDNNFKKDVLEYIDETFVNMEKINPTESINSVLKIFTRANKYIDETEPWALAKDETKLAELGNVLYNLSEVILKGATLLLPFLTTKAPEIFKYFNENVSTNFDNIKEFNILKSQKINKGENLFPRIDIQKELN